MDSYDECYGEYEVVEVLNEDVHFTCAFCGKQHKTRLVRLTRPWNTVVFQRDGRATPYETEHFEGKYCGLVCMVNKVVEDRLNEWTQKQGQGQPVRTRGSEDSPGMERAGST